MSLCNWYGVPVMPRIHLKRLASLKPHHKALRRIGFTLVGLGGGNLVHRHPFGFTNNLSCK